MPKRKQSKIRSFFNQHTVAGAIILILVGLILTESVIGLVFTALFNAIGLNGEVAGSIAAIVAALLALLIWRKWNAADYRPRSDAGSFLNSLKLAAPIILLWIAICAAYGIYVGGIPFRAIGLGSIATALMAGFVEEIVFREIGTSYLARQWHDEGKVLLMALVPGILFGVVHIANVASSGDLLDTLGQVLICIFAGVFYGAIFLRCGNIWPLIIVHALHDLIVFSAKGSLDSSTLPAWVNAAFIIGFLVLGIYGLFLIRKSKRTEIVALWDRRWSRSPEA